MILSRINQSVFFGLRGAEFLKVRLSGICSTAQTIVINSESERTSLSEIAEKPLLQNQSGKNIPITVEEFKNLRCLKPCQPENPHLLKVAILGEPNGGKSTLTNNLVKWKVCAVSRKVHTTRKRSAAVLVEQNKQIVFLDTPGFVTPEMTKRHNLEPSFVMDPIRSIREADLIAVVIDIANKWTNNRINVDILEVLESYRNKKSILILNKIDAMKSKSRLLSLTRILTGGIVGGQNSNIIQDQSKKDLSIDDIVQLASIGPDQIKESSTNPVHSQDADKNRGWTSFARVFMVSALRNDGMDELREYLLSETLPMDWQYHDSTVTDQHPHEIAKMTVREKLLEYLPEEIPYLLDVRITKWEVLSTGCPKIDIKIICSNSRHKRFVIGPGGKHITACVEKSRKAMREAFRKDVVLNIGVEQKQ